MFNLNIPDVKLWGREWTFGFVMSILLIWRGYPNFLKNIIYILNTYIQILTYIHVFMHTYVCRYMHIRTYICTHKKLHNLHNGWIILIHAMRSWTKVVKSSFSILSKYQIDRGGDHDWTKKWRCGQRILLTWLNRERGKQNYWFNRVMHDQRKLKRCGWQK